MHIFVAFMLLIICFCIGCSHVMMHKGQTHIRRNCFSIYIISNKLQIGCYIGGRRTWTVRDDKGGGADTNIQPAQDPYQQNKELRKHAMDGSRRRPPNAK
jgi:hypothetical protein